MTERIGKILYKKDRPDVVGRITGYVFVDDEYTIEFQIAGNKYSPWNSAWGYALMELNLRSGWTLADSSPVLDLLWGL